MFILQTTAAQTPFWFQTPTAAPKSDVETILERAERELLQEHNRALKGTPSQKSPTELKVQELERKIQSEHDHFTSQILSGTQTATGYEKTPVEKEVDRLEQEIFRQHQEFMRNPRAGNQTNGAVDSASILGLQPSGHNTFTRPGFSGKWIKQLDGTLFYEGGKHIQTNTPLNPGTYLNGQPLANRTTPLLGTREIAELNLTRNQDGTFSNPEINGKFLLQWDGSMYFTGGLDKNGQAVAPYTYRSGSAADPRKFNPLPSTIAIASSGLIPNADGVTFSKPGMPGRFVPQVDGSIFYEGGNTIKNGVPVPYRPQTFVPGHGIDQSRDKGDIITDFILKVKVERDKDGNLSFTDSSNKTWRIRIEGNELLYTGNFTKTDPSGTKTTITKTQKFIGLDASGKDIWKDK